MKILGASLLLATLLQTPATFAAGSICSMIFDQTQPQQEVVDRVIYDLANMRLNLDIAKAQGLNSVAMTGIISEYGKKEQAVIRDLESRGIMTRAEVLQKMSLQITQIQNRDQAQREKNKRDRNDQGKQVRALVVDGQTAVFGKVAAGEIKMLVGRDEIHVKVTKDFEIMATTVTQIIWKKVVQLAKTKLGDKYQLPEDPSTSKGDTFPVTDVSSIVVKEWISAFNELSRNGEPALSDFVVGHKQGDIYDLPTDAQWDFVIYGRGKLTDEYYFGKDSDQLGDHAWVDENSQGQVHPVAQKRPLKFENVEIYDMLGNVWEYTRDLWTFDLPNSGILKLIRSRGGGANSNASLISSQSQQFFGERQFEPFLGFRLIREVQDQDGK